MSAAPQKIDEKATSETIKKLELVKKEIHRIIYGQEDVVNLSLTGVLAGGHIMLIGVPGLAKTLLVETFGQVLGLSSKRIQCTPDLMPSDIIGTEILDQNGKSSSFRFVEGPVFTNLLMADEINRASPRTQSALLQAMQERCVSVAGDTKTLPHPFHVLATRNPLEQEGTYPLPEAQLDRFIMQIHIGYPDLETETQILTQTTGGEKLTAEMRMSHEDFELAQAAVRNLPVGEDFVARVVRIIREARPETSSLKNVKEFVNWAPGPRAGQSLIMAAKAHAMLNGRMTPDSSDIETLAFSVLNHRMALNYSARSHNIHLKDLIAEIFDSAA